MLLNSCANSPLEAEGHFKSAKILNHIKTHNTARRFSYSLCNNTQYKSDGRNHVSSFSSALHFSSTHSSNISIRRHIQSPTRAWSVPLGEQSTWQRRIYIRWWSLWPFWPRQQGTGWQVLPSLFSPQTLLL